MIDRFKSLSFTTAKLLALLILIAFLATAMAQDSENNKDNGGDPLETALKGLELRTIGPAFMSGRIADIVIHPENHNVWYVGVGSGGVWKTENSGTTWTSIFDGQGSYSIGDLALDPSNPNTLWVGTGENVGGRHVGYGDGVYVSHDGGSTWKNVGLETSEHIGKIVIHPDDSNTVWVAAEGPLWSSGGERGLYKTTDGARTGHGPWSATRATISGPA